MEAENQDGVQKTLVTDDQMLLLADYYDMNTSN